MTPPAHRIGLLLDFRVPSGRFTTDPCLGLHPGRNAVYAALCPYYIFHWGERGLQSTYPKRDMFWEGKRVHDMDIFSRLCRHLGYLRRIAFDSA